VWSFDLPKAKQSLENSKRSHKTDQARSKIVNQFTGNGYCKRIQVDSYQEEATRALADLIAPSDENEKPCNKGCDSLLRDFSHNGRHLSAKSKIFGSRRLWLMITEWSVSSEVYHQSSKISQGRLYNQKKGTPNQTSLLEFQR
jgi:hypothetical protein